jgi:hypothetical protein
VRHEIGPIATPDVIQFAPGLPKTRSGKIMRRILRKIAENDVAIWATPARWPIRPWLITCWPIARTSQWPETALLRFPHPAFSRPGAGQPSALLRRPTLGRTCAQTTAGGRSIMSATILIADDHPLFRQALALAAGA